MTVVEPTLPVEKPDLVRRRIVFPASLARLFWAAMSVLVATALLGGLIWGYWSTSSAVTIAVDGLPVSLRTHQATVGGLLDELGLVLAPEDLLVPTAEMALSSGLSVEVQRARPIVVRGTRSEQVFRTQATQLGTALAEAGIILGPADEVFLEEQPVSADMPLPVPSLADDRTASGLPRAVPWQDVRVQPLNVFIRRAVPMVLHEDGFSSTILSTATTVGEALAREGLIFYLGDRVEPGLGSPLTAGLNVYVERSRPVTIRTQAGLLATRTRRETVADLLTEQRLLLTGLDRVNPPLSTPLKEDMEVHISRVGRAFDVEEEISPYLSVWEPDPEMEIDNRRLDQEGVSGITRHRYVVVLEDGEPITRTLQETWLAQEPITKVLKYGTNVVLRELETPQGSLTYWRKIRMFATSYSADEAGVPRDAPYYGRTRSGTRVGYGIAAVDPRVIKLGTDVYVPGYGVASADDTGGAIKGRWIDVAYEEGQLQPWSRCVDVYVLAPVPPSYQIQYLLPNWPQVNCLR
jgi:uncharacterized protein YabE (DUF348 family)